jgi:3-methyladenine DNA glycosylase AlkD
MIQHLLESLVCERFRSDKRYRDGHLRVVNALPHRSVLGLHAPEIRHVAATLSKEGAEVCVNGEWRLCSNGAGVIACFEESDCNLCHEEIVIWGFLINHEKCSVEQRLNLLQRYVPVIDNWAVCDSYCAHAKWMARVDKELLWDFLQQWFSSEREFEVRFALVTAMCYLLNDDWLEPLFRRINKLPFSSIKSEYRSERGKPLAPQQGTVQGAAPYYVRMGVAWLLATALDKFPERTRSFVANSHLPDDVVRLYVRKARESRRTREVAAM